jgi:hypothetical protein
LPKWSQLLVNTVLFAVCIYPSWIVASELEEFTAEGAEQDDEERASKASSRSHKGGSNKKLHEPLLTEDYRSSAHEPYNNL